MIELALLISLGVNGEVIMVIAAPIVLTTNGALYIAGYCRNEGGIGGKTPPPVPKQTKTTTSGLTRP